MISLLLNLLKAFAVGGATATILGPVMSYADPNNTSIVLRLDHGENSFLFTGDMEIDAETDMMNHWNDDSLFQVDVLKMGHHGSSTSTGYRLLNATEATYALIPVGKNNDYGHPHRETLEKIRQASLIAMRTDDLDGAVEELKQKGYSFRMETAAYTDDGKLKNIYLDGEFGGFAIHILNKPV